MLDLAIFCFIAVVLVIWGTAIDRIRTSRRNVKSRLFVLGILGFVTTATMISMLFWSIEVYA